MSDHCNVVLSTTSVCCKLANSALIDELSQLLLAKPDSALPKCFKLFQYSS